MTATATPTARTRTSATAAALPCARMSLPSCRPAALVASVEAALRGGFAMPSHPALPSHLATDSNRAWDGGQPVQTASRINNQLVSKPQSTEYDPSATSHAEAPV